MSNLLVAIAKIIWVSTTKKYYLKLGIHFVTEQKEMGKKFLITNVDDMIPGSA